VTCARCGTQLAPDAKVCPSCLTLVHAAELNRLAALAEAPATPLSDALAAWRRALELLPPGTTQQGEISKRIETLSAQVTTPPPPKTIRGKVVGALSAIGLALWKLKFAVLFVLGKAKFLLLGLTKASTFFSMMLSLGVYWTAFGWRFALGLIASIYVHEMGHVNALRRYGIAATAPMFIPGFGALVRLKQYPASPAEDARVGLAGPLWGTFAAVAFLGAGAALEWPSLLAIARAGAWINLFNLIPVWQLDGGRGFNALSRLQRSLCAALLFAAYLVVGDGLVLLLALGAAFRAFATPSPEKGDSNAAALYAGLAAGLGLVILAAKELTAVAG
jgi:Zn-dependent protease